MLRYITDMTIIWLACLLVYELILKKESFYKYNRLFLLVALAAGIILPKLDFQKEYVTAVAEGNALARPVQQLYELKHQVVTATPIQDKELIQPVGWDAATVLWMLYLSGVVIFLLGIAKEIIQLMRLYKAGKRTVEGRCTIVETGQSHAPFSFFHVIFVKNKQDYDGPGWQFVLQHEKEHGRLLHSLDNLLLILCRVIFWFHPLVHIYYKRVRAIHEYQADAIADNIVAYGSFLVEQTLFDRTPILVHSLHYSSIKNRIAMLTKSPSAKRRLLKYLVAAPVFSLLVVFCTQTSFSESRKQERSTVLFKGNEIEFGAIKVVPPGYRQKLEQQRKMFAFVEIPDSVLVEDRVTREPKMELVATQKVPVALNGKHIFGNEFQFMLSETAYNYTEPSLSLSKTDLERHLFSVLHSDLNKLEDGEYVLNLKNVVVDEKGSIAYYENPKLEVYMSVTEKRPSVDKVLSDAITQKIVAEYNSAIKFKPAKKDGNAVSARLGLDNYEIVVKNHAATLTLRAGC